MSSLVLACVGPSAILPDTDPEVPFEFEVDGGEDGVDPERVRKMLEEDAEEDQRRRETPERKDKPAAVLPDPDFFPRPTPRRPQIPSDDDDGDGDDDSENGGNGDGDDGEHASVRRLPMVTGPEGDWNRCGC